LLGLADFTQFPDDHRAGTAIAFRATLFGAGAVQVFAQMLQNGAGKRLMLYLLGGTAKIKAYRFGHGDLCLRNKEF
jgi:hypothetical protein